MSARSTILWMLGSSLILLILWSTGILTLPARTTNVPEPKKMPVEAEFVAASVKMREQYDSVPNDLAKASLRTERKRLLCEALPTLEVSDWSGTIYSLSSSDGFGDLEVLIGPKIYLT